MSATPMSKVKEDDEMRPEYRREELGKGVRGKYHARVTRGTNVVLLNPRVAKAFPTSEAVNAALEGLLDLAEQTRRRAPRTASHARRRTA